MSQTSKINMLHTRWEPYSKDKQGRSMPTITLAEIEECRQENIPMVKVRKDGFASVLHMTFLLTK